MKNKRNFFFLFFRNFFRQNMTEKVGKTFGYRITAVYHNFFLNSFKPREVFLSSFLRITCTDYTESKYVFKIFWGEKKEK